MKKKYSKKFWKMKVYRRKRSHSHQYPVDLSNSDRKILEGGEKVSACPGTEADNKRTGRAIIVINVSEMSLCAVLQWPQGLDDKDSRYIIKRSIFLLILKSNSLTDTGRRSHARRLLTRTTNVENKAAQT